MSSMVSAEAEAGNGRELVVKGSSIKFNSASPASLAALPAVEKAAVEAGVSSPTGCSISSLTSTPSSPSESAISPPMLPHRSSRAHLDFGVISNMMSRRKTVDNGCPTDSRFSLSSTRIGRFAAAQVQALSPSYSAGTGDIYADNTSMESYELTDGSSNATEAESILYDHNHAYGLAVTSMARPAASHTAVTCLDSNVYSSNIEDYDIKENIGFGASAYVVRANFKPLDHDVAIKVVDLESYANNQIDELRREIQIMLFCRHPNLLAVHRSFIHNDCIHIVTPLRTAGSIAHLLKHLYPTGLPELAITNIAAQVLSGLTYLHSNRLIHRDIKSANILLERETGLVQVADFGVSNTLSELGDVGLGVTYDESTDTKATSASFQEKQKTQRKHRKRQFRRSFVGSLLWMAPEVMEQKEYNYKADIWSFGVMLLEMAQGQPPYAHFPPLKVCMMVLSGQSPELDRSATQHEYSLAFKQLIDSCLEFDPNLRPTADSLLKTSHLLKRHINIPTGPHTPQPTITTLQEPPSVSYISPKTSVPASARPVRRRSVGTELFNGARMLVLSAAPKFNSLPRKSLPSPPGSSPNILRRAFSRAYKYRPSYLVELLNLHNLPSANIGKQPNEFIDQSIPISPQESAPQETGMKSSVAFAGVDNSTLPSSSSSFSLAQNDSDQARAVTLFDTVASGWSFSVPATGSTYSEVDGLITPPEEISLSLKPTR